MVDENYSVVASHVDDATYRKIVSHEYVNFSKLIAKDKVMEEERGVELVPIFKAGKTVFAPTHERDSTVISSFSKWEQAFRVFSAVYTREHPHRAYELIQYNHMIYDASLNFVWNNVYAYDRDFRIHHSYNPGRSWAIILQQAWMFRLKTKLSEVNGGHPGHANNNNSSNRQSWGQKREVCYRFNRGKCSYGSNCKFEHKCQVCNKRGHGAWNCRKIQGNNGGNNNQLSGAATQQAPIFDKDKETGEKKRRVTE